MGWFVGRGLILAAVAVVAFAGQFVRAQQAGRGQPEQEEFDPSAEFEKRRGGQSYESPIGQDQPYDARPSMREGLRPRPRGAGIDGSGGRGPRASQEVDYRGFIAPHREGGTDSYSQVEPQVDPLMPEGAAAWLLETERRMPSNTYVPALVGYESLLGISPMITEMESRRGEWYSGTIAGRETERQRMQNELRARSSRLPSSDRFGPGNNHTTADGATASTGGAAFGSPGMRSPGMVGMNFAGPSLTRTNASAGASMGHMTRGPGAGPAGPGTNGSGVTGQGSTGQGLSGASLPASHPLSPAYAPSRSNSMFLPGPMIPGLIGPNQRSVLPSHRPQGVGTGAGAGAAGRAGQGAGRGR